MSEEQLKAFLEKVKADTNLQEKLKAAADADAVVSIAKEEGLHFSADDLEGLHFSADDLKNANQLSDEEVEGVAGGACSKYCATAWYQVLFGACTANLV